jgi:hypothetical protein
MPPFDGVHSDESTPNKPVLPTAPLNSPNAHLLPCGGRPASRWAARPRRAAGNQPADNGCVNANGKWFVERALVVRLNLMGDR